jgi:sugar phosphate permease
MNQGETSGNYKVYGYRWIVLIAYSIITMLIQIQWLTFAPVAREAKNFYAASSFQIDLLSMIFMIVFIIICIPASYIIDTYGIRKGIGTGAILTGIFGMMKGIYAHSFTMVIISQVGLAVAQPFIINAATKVAVKWFPINERATAVGLATLSQFVGIVIVMMVTPLLLTVNSEGLYNFSGMLMTYGIISVGGAVFLLILVREEPPTPPCEEGQESRFRVFEGIRHMLKQKDMIIALIIFFLGLGMFNGISTCIDQICEIKKFSIEQTGLIGGIMLIAGIIGAIILPPLSDKYRKRKIFLVLAMLFIIPGLVGLTFSVSYPVVLVSSFIIGFFLLGAGAPVGFQYCAEVSYPAPESSSQGLILLSGQISGILFIIGMNKIGMIEFLMFFIFLAVVTFFLSTKLNESKMILENE